VCNAAQNVSHPEMIMLGLPHRVRREGTIADIGRSLNDTPEEFPGVLQLNDEGIHYACLYV
jgi:hypothetical protein